MPSWLTLFTVLHVAISLVAIAAGFVVCYDMMRGRASRRWTAVFLVMTILTSVTGFGFPATRITPAHVFGVVSLVALGLAVYGNYMRQLAGKWRVIYIVSALLSQYLNVVVLIVQSFQKIPVLHVLAPTQSEPIFLAVQGLTLVAFVFVGFRAIRESRKGLLA